MAIHLTSRALLTAFALTTIGLAQTPAPCPTSNQPQTSSSKPCTPSTNTTKPSAAEQFPFPGQPAKPASPPDAPNSAPATNPAAVDHPFPTAPPPRLPGDDSSSSSSSSNSRSDDANPDVDPAPDPTPDPAPGTEGSSTHRKLPKVKRVQTDDERVDEDLNVARFYMGDENFQGAYLRSKDAVKLQPDYAATHFALAVAAQKLKKKDEAVAEYKAYLKLDPDGEKSKAAHDALNELK